MQYVLQISCPDFPAKGPRHQDFDKNYRWLKELQEHVRCPPGWSAWDRAEPLSFGTADRKQSLRCEDGLYFTERSYPTFVRLFGKSIPGYDANAWHLDWRPFTDPAAPVPEATMRAFADAIRDAHTQLGPEFTASPISVRLLACGRPARAARRGRRSEDTTRSEEEADRRSEDTTGSEEEADRRSYYTDPIGCVDGISRRRALKRAFVPYSPAMDAKEEEYHRQNMLVADQVAAEISAFAPGWQTQLASPAAGGGGLDLVIERASGHGAHCFAALLRRLHGAETEDLPSFGLDEYSPEDLVPIFRRFTQRMLKRADVVTARTRFAQVYRPNCSAAHFHKWIQAMETWAELMRKRVAAKHGDGGAGVRVILFVTRPDVEPETEEEGARLIGEKWRTWTFADPGHASELRLIPDAKLSELSARHDVDHFKDQLQPFYPPARKRILELDP